MATAKKFIPFMATKPEHIILGNTVKDVVTGFIGTATSKHEYMNKCVQIGVEPEMKKGEKTLPERQVFDFQRLQVTGQGIADKIFEMNIQTERNPGGPPRDVRQRV